MNTRKTVFKALLGACLVVPVSALAGEQVHEEKLIIVQTQNGERIEADISELAPGESETFFTDSGRTVDLLQTTEGLEVYIDGELVDLGSDSLHLEKHLARVHEHMECAAGDCDDHFAYAWQSKTDEAQDIQVFSKKIEIACSDEYDCDENVWISADGELDLHELADLEGHEVIVIRDHREKVIEQ